MPEILGFFVLVFFVFIILAVLVSCVRIVPQSYVLIVERLGAYHKTLHVGVHFMLPLIDRIRMRINLKEQVLDSEPQPVITRDNITLHIDSVAYFQVTDPKLFAYGIERPLKALELMSATSLRNLIGELELDQTLTSRESINGKMRIVLDEVTDPWGIKVTRVEIKNIITPRDLQEAMEKQMRAERERRESILRAEGEKQSAILIAEGEKEAVILRADAKKEQTIREAEGQARALERIFEAQAKGIELINGSHPSQEYLTLKSFESLEKVADGQATKLIIPSTIQDLAGTLAALSATVEKAKK